jgi:hypothetical protein
MARLWRKNDRSYISGKDIFVATWPVEQEKELVFWMIPNNSFQRFIGKPTYTFQPVGQKEPCVDSNFHKKKQY